MSAYEDLARSLLEEIPLSRLRAAFKDAGAAASGQGTACGLNCHGQGTVCGMRCTPRAGDPDVFDREGRLKISADEFADIRKNIPRLRQVIASQVDDQMKAFR